MFHCKCPHNFVAFPLKLQIFLVFVSFKYNVEGPFKIELSSFSCAVDFRKDIQINILKDCFVLTQFTSQLNVMFITFF